MRRFRCAALAAVAVIGFASVASAADLPVKAGAPVAAIGPNWAGFYVGANAGYAWNDPTAQWTGDGPDGAGNALLNGAFASLLSFNSASYAQSLKSDGFTGGGQVGYNWQFARIVVAGLEADFQYADLQGSASSSGTAPLIDAPMTATSNNKLKWFGTVRARAGVLFADQRLLAYVTGGLAYGRTQLNANATTTPGGFFGSTTLGCAVNGVCIAGSGTKTSTGWTAGGGLEWLAWSKTRLRVEYMHVDLGEQTIRLVAQSPAVGDGFANVSVKNSFDVVRVGLNYAF